MAGMADRLTPEARSSLMKKIRGKDTAPEMIVRRLLHGMGYRFRLHAPELPGKPDIVFRPRRKAVLVHGCYWHGHGCSRGGKGAKSNQDYWGPKIARTRARDAASV
jgi:DNA mismatch endonuclease (patch repair protein)